VTGPPLLLEELEELELELLLELLLTPPLELLELELELLELLELLLELLLLVLLPLLLELLLTGVLSLPPPQAARMKLAQTANVSAGTEARLRCRGRVECMCFSSIKTILWPECCQELGVKGGPCQSQ
jgi:hypothetical protein